MAKYSDGFKRKVVTEYMEGSLGYVSLAKKHGMPHHTPIHKWVNAFQTFGSKGLKRKRKKTIYPVQFKIDVLHFMKRTGASLHDTANQFGLNNPPLITSWKRVFEKEGIEGLKENSKGRPPMSDHPRKKAPKTEKKQTREEALERQVELLQLENAYLKKLNAFRENPEAYLEKYKQRWHSNSKKHSD